MGVGMSNAVLHSDSRTPCVCVVLVNWNAQDLTVACLRSLYAGSLVPDAALVVDNASDVFDSEVFTEIDHSVSVIRNSENLGFTGANRVGIDEVLRMGGGIYGF